MSNNAHITIEAGNDGAEAQSWAAALVEMYLGWAKARELEVRGGHGFVMANEVQLARHSYRPHGFTWLAVETMAAKALGEQDAKEGRQMRPVRERALVLGYDLSKRPIPGLLLLAYRSAYLAAHGRQAS